MLQPILYLESFMKTHHYSNLSMCSVASYKDLSMIRIETRNSLMLLKETLGNTCGIGSRKLHPARGSGCSMLEVSNIVNMSNVSNNNEVRPKFKEVIPTERIDFVFEEQTRALSIRVKYSWFLAEDPLVSNVNYLGIWIARADRARSIRYVSY
jgi:hypothetical protein